ncbi:polysaccharide deacetylase family protein [Chryseobacterium sp. MYb264]|uniref:polysaccharide deacetylase family protein n=1 Tax=Chryseobacterium sp. MYb264 TaxID=2745153 RepID=UPI002E128C7F|nr:polysaccharide deacetylase family protein [Chryseobacterium sp. MYb264]
MKKYAVLGMDVEDWFHLDYFKKEECDTSQSTMDGLDIYLDLLNQYNIKTTFFVVGELVSQYEKQLKKIIENGHEIALHSYSHIRPLNLKIDDFRKDTEKGLAVLKDILNIEAKGYRAPCFSLDRERLDILKNEFNLNYDSSKIKFDSHDLYGRIDLDNFDKLKTDIYKKDNFFEFEASTVEVVGKSLPVSGGGYLRIFPWFITKKLLKKYLKTNGNYFFYIHPFEFSKNYNIKVPENTDAKTKLRFNAGRKSVEKKMHKLIKLLKENDYEFVTFQDLHSNKL